MTFDYEGWLNAAYRQLETLYKQKAAIEAEISKLEVAMKGFAPLVKNPSKWFGPQTGITDAIRVILKRDPNRIYTATEIRDELLMSGVTLKQKNPMATIHQILARLVESGIATVSAHEPGRNRYKWSGEIPEPQSRFDQFLQSISGLNDAQALNDAIKQEPVIPSNKESAGDRMLRIVKERREKDKRDKK
jgi:hypothetical protein